MIMNFSTILMLLGGVAFVLAVAWWFERDRISAWWTHVKGTKGGALTIEELNRVEEWAKATRGTHVPPVPPDMIPKAPPPTPAVPAPVAAASAEPAAAPVPPPVTAPSGDGGTTEPPFAFGLPRSAFSAPAAPAAQPKEVSTMDKGIVTAAQLLAGWQLPDYDVNPPVQGSFARRHADLMYLTLMARSPGGNQVFEDVIIGNQGEVNVCKNYAHTIGNDGLYGEDGQLHDWTNDSRVDANVKAEAQASIAAEKARMASRGRPLPTHDFSRYRLPAGTQIPSPRG